MCCASSSGFAQGSSVTIYGVVDMGIVRESGGAGGSVWKATSGIQNGSRYGFRGVEDLGGGLSAVFQLEGGLLIDTGGFAQGGLAWGRQAYVGFTGNHFGELTLGRVYSFVDRHLARIDPFITNSPAQADNLLIKGYTVRADNGVKYLTSDLAGARAGVIYGFGEDPAGSSVKRYLGTLLSYERGPIYAGVAQQFQHTQSTALVNGSTNRTLVGGAYNFGVAKLHLGYAIDKTSVGTVTTEDYRDCMIGVGVPMNAGTFLANYTQKNDRLPARNDAWQIGTGYTYDLSKRTSLYAFFAHLKNKNKAAFTVNPSAVAGTGTRAVAAGVRHVF
jgi:predicted porin